MHLAGKVGKEAPYACDTIREWFILSQVGETDRRIADDPLNSAISIAGTLAGLWGLFAENQLPAVDSQRRLGDI
jgi:hypothetical protein